MTTSREHTVTTSRWSLARQWRACAAAFTFLTRIPTSWFGAHDAGDLADATFYFPLVGFVVAAIGATAYWIGTRLWPVPVAVVLSVVAMVWVTGAFHEDALADSLDGFGGGWDPQQILIIMKDSRVGSYALVGMVLVMLVKVTTLIGIAEGSVVSVWPVIRALVAGHVLGRWSSVVLMSRYTYVRADDPTARISAGRTLMHAVTRTHVAVATGLTCVLLVAFGGVRTIPAWLVAIVVTWGAGRYFQRRLGGITGDALGAANQMVEVCVYLTLATHLVSQW